MLPIKRGNDSVRYKPQNTEHCFQNITPAYPFIAAAPA